MESRLRQSEIFQQAVVAPASIAVLPLPSVSCRKHQVRPHSCSLLDLAKPEQQLPQFDGERHLPLLPSLPHHGQQHVVEVEVDDASRQEFIDPAPCVEDRAGDGVDAPLNERLRAIAEDPTQNAVV